MIDVEENDVRFFNLRWNMNKDALSNSDLKYFI
jgi:hypothetical protein